MVLSNFGPPKKGFPRHGPKLTTDTIKLTMEIDTFRSPEFFPEILPRKPWRPQEAHFVGTLPKSLVLSAVFRIKVAKSVVLSALLKVRVAKSVVLSVVLKVNAAKSVVLSSV